MSAFKNFLSPFDLKGIALKNRVALAPMTRARSGVDQIPKPHMIDYYVQRASVGLIITEATIISQQGMGWAHAPAIYTPEHVAGWKPIVEKVHEAGGVIFCQLWHMGRVCHSSFHGIQPVSSSAVAARGDGVRGGDYEKHPYEVPHALTEEEIAGVVSDYKHAAELAKEAGFDGIEVHGANGYLLDQFLQSNINVRTDKYGGSLENRFRIIGEVLEAVSEVYPSNRVGIRFSPNGVFNDCGNEDNFDSFSYFIAQLEKYNLGYLHVMDGLAFGFHNKCAPVTLADVRKLFTGPVIGNCGYNAETAEEAIASGGADLIAIGRPMITNPDYVARIANGWPLAEMSDPSTWYTPPFEDDAKNYSDFPAYAGETA